MAGININNIWNLLSRPGNLAKKIEKEDLISFGKLSSIGYNGWLGKSIRYKDFESDLKKSVLSSIPPPPIVNTDINYSTVAWVDRTFGNNSTGVLGRFDKPFASYQGALAAINVNYNTLTATNRALIYMRSGNYGNHSTMWLRSHIDTYCEPGVSFGVFSRIRDSFYSALDGVVNCNWYGHASYFNAGSSTATFFELNGNSNIHAEFDTIDSHSGPMFIGASGTAYFKCTKIKSKGFFQSGSLQISGNRNTVIDITDEIRCDATPFKLRAFTGKLVVNCPKMIISNISSLGGNFKQVVLVETSTTGTSIFNGDMIQEDTETYFGGIGGVFTTWSGGGGDHTINGNIYANNSRAGIYRGSANAIVKHNGSISSKRRIGELNVGTTVFNNGGLVNYNTYALLNAGILLQGAARCYINNCLLYTDVDEVNAVTITNASSRLYMYNSLYSGNGLVGDLIFSTVAGAIVQLHNIRSTKGVGVNVTDELTPTGLIVDPVLVTPNFI